MADMILTGIVQADGHILIKETLDLPVGAEIKLVVQPQAYGVTLETAKTRLAEVRSLTNEEWAEYHHLYAELDKAFVIESGLPDDYIDELDHYLYETPKRDEI